MTAYEIHNVPYLAVATVRNESSRFCQFPKLIQVGKLPTYQGISQIFYWETNSFQLYQNLSTLYTEKLAFFQIDQDFYLAAAYATGNYSVINLDSQVFKWIE